MRIEDFIIAQTTNKKTLIFQSLSSNQKTLTNDRLLCVASAPFRKTKSKIPCGRLLHWFFFLRRHNRPLAPPLFFHLCSDALPPPLFFRRRPTAAAVKMSTIEPGHDSMQQSENLTTSIFDSYDKLVKSVQEFYYTKGDFRRPPLFRRRLRQHFDEKLHPAPSSSFLWSPKSPELQRVSASSATKFRRPPPGAERPFARPYSGKTYLIPVKCLQKMYNLTVKFRRPPPRAERPFTRSYSGKTYLIPVKCLQTMYNLIVYVNCLCLCFLNFSVHVTLFAKDV
ncbi:hypothetical protein LXL04_003940 [Taraxacum kok-saghyz]